MRSVPPCGSGWVVISEFSTEDQGWAVKPIDAIEIHPLPRGGTDLIFTVDLVFN